MTKQEFDNYRFGVKTRIVYFKDEYGEVVDKVTEVDFEERWVAIERGQIVRYHKIKKIFEEK